MKAKLIVEGKEFDIDILDPKLQELIKPEKKTGYERADKKSHYYFVDADGVLNGYDADEYDDVDSIYYEIANYYSDKAVAENNARADRLMRQLRRFAAENKKIELDWSNTDQDKWFIYYDNENKGMFYNNNTFCKSYGIIYFDSRETAELAAKTFHDELIWYFTKYKDSL